METKRLRDKKSKSQRVGERESLKDKETKRQRVKETKSGGDKETKRLRDKETKSGCLPQPLPKGKGFSKAYPNPSLKGRALLRR